MLKITKLHFLLAIVIVSCQPAPYEKEVQQLDKFISQAQARFDVIPGFSVAIVKDNTPILIKGYGFADHQTKEMVTPNTAFYIASTTKSFIGVLAIILEKEGEIDLDAPLADYKPFSELENKEIFETISSNDLLNHTSGLQNNFITFRSSFLGNLTVQDAIELAEKATRKGDNKYEYTNLGYNLFSLLLHEEFGYNWKDLLDQKIFQPNSMKNSSAYMSKASTMSNGYIGAQPEGTVESYIKTDPMMHAAGGLISSANDLANWLLFNLGDGQINNDQVYEKGVISKSHKSTVMYEATEGQVFIDNGYATGWHNGTFKDKEVVYHFGGYTGFQTHTSFLPNDGIGIAVLSNEQHFGDNLNSIIASYTYDVLLGIEPDEETYEKKFTELERLIASLTENFSKEKQPDTLKWNLSKSITSYQGTYKNEYMGTVIVNVSGEETQFTFGELSAIAKPTEAKDVMKVELIPGRPMDFIFKLDENEKINQFNSGGLPFMKILD